jgi:hypothetical protein
VDIRAARSMTVRSPSLTSRTDFAPLTKISNLSAASKAVKTQSKLDSVLVLNPRIVTSRRHDSTMVVQYVFCVTGFGVQVSKMYPLLVGPGKTVIYRQVLKHRRCQIPIRVPVASLMVRKVAHHVDGHTMNSCLFFAAESLHLVRHFSDQKVSLVSK